MVVSHAGQNRLATDASPSRRRGLRRRLSRPLVESLESRRLLTGFDPSPQVAYQVDADWTAGLQSAVAFVNKLPTAIKDWTLEFDLAKSIGTIWNARIASHVGNHYAIKSDGWNDVLNAGAGASFGFAASPGGASVTPTNYTLRWEDGPPAPAAPVSISFSVSDDWKTGFTGNVAIKNTGSSAITGWTLEFDFAPSIDSIWNASIVRHAGTHYVLKDAGYNASIAPGATVSFGFNASPGNVTSTPVNYKFNSAGVAGSQATPTLSVANASAGENAGSLTFSVSLSPVSASAVTVKYATLDGSAKAGGDYTNAAGTLTFNAGEATKTIKLPITNDALIESNEVFILRLTTPTNAAIGDGQATGTILDDDAPKLSINDLSVAEGDSGTANATFTVTLSKASTTVVTVNYATAADTATSGVDFTSVGGVLSFAAGTTSKTITVPVAGDTAAESTERFFVNLSAPVNATIADVQGIGTILDNDGGSAGAFNYAEAMQKALFFYEAARSGDLPSNYIVDWRADSAMNDGKDVGKDLTGGYYDAGDHVKFGLPMAYSMSMLAWGANQYRSAYAQTGQLDRILDAIRWGADYIVKAHTAPNEFYGQVGQGGLDHSFWGAPELMTMPRPSFKIDAQHPGSDLAGESAAALAATAIAFQTTDPTYANTLLQHAAQLFTFGDTYRGKYSDSISDAAGFYSSGSYMDDLIWAALWLYKATGQQSYLDKAEAFYAQNYLGQTMTWTQSWDDVRYGSVVLLARITGKDIYKKDAERYLDYWSVGINGGANRIKYTPGGLAFLTGWGSLRYSSATAFVALVYSDTVRDYNRRYHDFAVGQINYILGDNPQHRSYEVGFGQNYPKNEHHRGASGVWDGNVANPAANRHILYGALVGGPRSADDSDYEDVRTDYVGNEVALDYNAGFTGALARLALESGGKPLATFPIPDQRDLEFFAQADINQQGPTFTEVDVLLNNRSAWPARASSNLSFRYFVNLSELYAAGYTSSDVVVSSNYSQGATVGPLQTWDAAQRVYYVDVSFAGVSISPGAGTFTKEAQLRIGLKNGLPASAWNPANDWSYQGLVAGPGKNATTPYIPVYEAGKLLYGQTPGVSAPGTPSVSINSVSLPEGNSGQKNATFTVTLSEPTTKTVTVAYATKNGTASAGSDYVATSGTLSFAPGTTSLTILVPVMGDTAIESNETFSVVLTNPTNSTIGTGTGTGTITDDDAPVAAVDVNYNVSDDWGTGFVAGITIKNNQPAAIANWLLEFDLAVRIDSIWNADIVSHVGNRWVIKPKSYNQQIGAGQSVNFGFQGSPGNAPKKLANVVFNGKAL